jgi:hypothetical protein
MILEPKVSYYVQETILTAINIGDLRIINFIADNTNFPETIIKHICDNYREAVSLLLSSSSSSQAQLAELLLHTSTSHLSAFFPTSTATTTGSSSHPALSRLPSSISVSASSSSQFHPPLLTPVKSTSDSRLFPGAVGPSSASHNRSSSSLSASTTSKTTGQSPLERFIKSILFMKAIHSCLYTRFVELENKKDFSLPTSPNGFPSYSSTGSTKSSKNQANKECKRKLEILSKKIAFLYQIEFIDGILLPALESSNELSNIITYYLLRILFLSLYDANNDNNENSISILSSSDSASSSLSSKKKRRQQGRKRRGSSNASRVRTTSSSSTDEAIPTEMNGNNVNEILPSPLSPTAALHDFFQSQPLLSLTLKSLFVSEALTHPNNNSAFSTSASGDTSDENQKMNGSSTSAGSLGKQFCHNNHWLLLFDRTSSMSKLLSMISLQCLDTILSISPPIFLFEYLAVKPLKVNQQQYDIVTAQMKGKDSTSSNSSITTSSTSSSTSSHVDIWNLRLIDDYSLTFNEMLHKITKTIPLLEDHNVPSHIIPLTSSLTSHYIQFTVQQILRKLYYKGDYLYLLHYSTFLSSTSSSSSSSSSSTAVTAMSLYDNYDLLLYNDDHDFMNSANSLDDGNLSSSSSSSISTRSTTSTSSTVYYYIYNDIIIEKLFRRLSSFFSMKIDEQILFSQLLYDLFIHLSLLIIITKNELICKQLLTIVMQYLKKVSYLLEEMQKKYLKQVNDNEKKLNLFRIFLLEEAKESLFTSSVASTTVSTSGSSSTMNKGPKQQTSAASSSSTAVVSPTPPVSASKSTFSSMLMSTPAKSTPPSTASDNTVTPGTTTKRASITGTFLKKSFNFMGGSGQNSVETSTHDASTNSPQSSSHQKQTNPVPNARYSSFLSSSPLTSTHGKEESQHSQHQPQQQQQQQQQSPSDLTLNSDSVHSNDASESKENSNNSKTSLKKDDLRKIIEGENQQQQSILTGYIILQEISLELQSFIYSIDYIKTLFSYELQLKPLESFYDETSAEEDEEEQIFGTGGVEEGDWMKEMIVNDYEEDEEDLTSLKQLLSSLSSTNTINDYMNKEIDFINEFDMLQSSLDQMVSVTVAV